MILGITGGVGAGKSTVLEILEKEYNAHNIIADDVAKELMEPEKPVYNAAVKKFGSSIVKRDGSKEIDKAILADIIYQDADKRRLLNSLVHPAVKKEIVKTIKDIYKIDADALIVVEAALLIEDGYKEIVDELWGVRAEKDVRIHRLMRDRGYSEEKAKSIMTSQLSDEEYAAHADFIIDNSKTEKETSAQVHKRMKEMKN